MQKMNIILLLPALFISSYIIGMDQQEQFTGSDSSHYLSFSEGTTSTSTIVIQPLISSYPEGTSSGSGEENFSPNELKSKKPIVPKLDLETREEIFALQTQKECHEKIGKAIKSLEQFNPDSTRKSSSPILIVPITRKERVLSHETVLTREQSKEKVNSSPITESSTTSPSSPRQTHQSIVENQFAMATKTPQIYLSPQTSPVISPRKSSTETAPETPSAPPTSLANSSEIRKEIPQISITPETTSSPDPIPLTPRKTNTEISNESAKITKQQTNFSEKKDITEINKTSKGTNPTSMRPLTWKDGRTALLTITGLLALLYYLDKLPGNISAKIDNILASLRMNR